MSDRDQLLREAWVGDAVLELYARLRVLRDHGTLDAEETKHLCSNQFLSAFGEPSAIEAEIGRAFEKDGLDGAFLFIERRLIPLYERQQENRRKRR